jgi:hypothetical protein
LELKPTTRSSPSSCLTPSKKSRDCFLVGELSNIVSDNVRFVNDNGTGVDKRSDDLVRAPLLEGDMIGYCDWASLA